MVDCAAAAASRLCVYCTTGASIVESAVLLARDGFDVPKGLAGSLSGAVASKFKPYPADVAAYGKNGIAYAQGGRMKQPDLARTLERIRDGGRDGFYKRRNRAPGDRGNETQRPPDH